MVNLKGILFVILGGLIAGVCVMAQIGISFTPYRDILGSFGIIFLMIAAIISLLAVLRTGRHQLYYLGLAFAGLAVLSSWQYSYQLGISGVAIGVIVIGIGIYSFRKQS